MSISRATTKLQTLRQRDGDWCWVCGEGIDFSLPREHHEAGTLDHFIPRAQGGTNHNDNLKLAHRTCNEARGRFYLRDWAAA